MAATFDEQPNIVGWSADGTGLYYTETEGTVTRLGLLPADGGAPKALNSGNRPGLSGPPQREADDVRPRRSVLGFPAEAFVTPVGKWAPVQVSRANADSPKHPLGRTEVVRWKARDGLEIEGLLTYPAGYEKGRRYPMVLVIHGGPTGVFTQSYVAMRNVYPIAAFAAEGWAVLRCNIRGSSGYGRTFRLAN